MPSEEKEDAGKKKGHARRRSLWKLERHVVRQSLGGAPRAEILMTRACCKSVPIRLDRGALPAQVLGGERSPGLSADRNIPTGPSTNEEMPEVHGSLASSLLQLAPLLHASENTRTSRQPRPQHYRIHPPIHPFDIASPSNCTFSGDSSPGLRPLCPLRLLKVPHGPLVVC